MTESEGTIVGHEYVTGFTSFTVHVKLDSGETRSYTYYGYYDIVGVLEAADAWRRDDLLNRRVKLTIKKNGTIKSLKFVSSDEPTSSLNSVFEPGAIPDS